MHNVCLICAEFTERSSVISIIVINKLENQCTRRAQLVAYDEGKNTIFVYCDIFYVHVYTTINFHDDDFILNYQLGSVVYSGSI